MKEKDEVIKSSASLFTSLHNGAKLKDDKKIEESPDLQTTTEKEPEIEEIKAKESKTSDDSKPAKKSAAKSLKILVAEDERPLAKVLNLKLTSLGFIVTVAYDGEEALEQASKEKFDLIILDLVMPKVDGFEVLTDLKEKAIKTPVIVMSNLSQAEDITKAKAMGAVEFFIKSDTPIAVIVEFIKKFLNV